MRHYKKGRKLGTDSSHTKAMKRNLLVAVFTNDRIKTVEARAKEVRSDIDRIITWAKKGDLHSRRLAIASMGDKELVREVFEKAKQGMWGDRQGGYTRILKLGPRKGDNAPMVILELVTEPVAGAAAAKSGKSGADAKKGTASAKSNSKKAAGADATAEEAKAADEAKASDEAEVDAKADEIAEDAADEAADAKAAEDAGDAEEAGEADEAGEKADADDAADAEADAKDEASKADSTDADAAADKD